MRDGAHTHHGTGGAGLAEAVLAALAVAACSGAIAAAFTALIHLLLIILAVITCLAITCGILAAATTRLRRDRRESWLTAARSTDVPAQRAASRPVHELAALQAEVASLRQQLTRPEASQPDRGYHQHLHFHGTDLESVLRTIGQNGGDAS
jgi:hypothetical protein